MVVTGSTTACYTSFQSPNMDTADFGQRWTRLPYQDALTDFPLSFVSW
jgi:hypothetical protein